MRLAPPKCHIGEVGAIAGTGRIPRPRDLFPFGGVNGGKTRVAVGPGMHFGDFQAIGAPHPLRIDFGAADDRDLSGETSQRVAGGNCLGVGEGSRDHSAGGAIGGYRA